MMHIEAIAPWIAIALTLIGMIVTFNNRSRDGEHRISKIEMEQKHAKERHQLLESRFKVVEGAIVKFAEIKKDIEHISKEMDEIKSSIRDHNEKY